MREIGWRSGSRMTAGASIARRSFAKGIALGMVPTGTPADDPRVVSLIFEPGFSTRDTVSELSGRGVGLDVVRDAVRALRGSVAVESTPGKGTAFIFRLPLTLALIDGLLVEAARWKIRGADGAGRGMRGARSDGIGAFAGEALRVGAGRAGSDGFAAEPVSCGRAGAGAAGVAANAACAASGSASPSTAWSGGFRR